MNLISAHTHKPLRFASFSITPSPSQFPSPPLLKPYAPDSTLSSATFATTNDDARRNFMSPVVAKASATSGFVLEIGEILGDLRIFTAAGEPVLFKDLWDQKEGMAVVALLRHFGCPCCWELASTLKESKARFDSSGVKLIAIGVGTPNKARILAERD